MQNGHRQTEEEHVRREEADRLLRWSRDNRSDWRLICRRDDLEDAQLYRLLQEMLRHSFCQIAMILFSACAPKGSGRWRPL